VRALFLFATLVAFSHECASRGMAQVVSADTIAKRGMPAWIVRQFYSNPTFGDQAKYFTSSFSRTFGKGPTPGSLPESLGRVVSRELKHDEKHAVFATEASQGSHTSEWYTYLVLENGGWKIDAVRLFSVPIVHWVILDSLIARQHLPDSLLLIRDKLRLGAANDSSLAAYFQLHREALSQFAARFESVVGLKALADDGRVFPTEALAPAEAQVLARELRNLRLGAAIREKDSAQCVRYKIGGTDRNSVGFLHVLPGCPRPTMDPAALIYVDAVGENWFVYRS
jgi:hypothetical protein